MKRVSVYAFWAVAGALWCAFWFGLAALIYWVFFVLK